MGGYHYLPATTADRQAMLAAIGAGHVTELFAAIPDNVRLNRALNLPPARSELELTALLRKMAAQDTDVDAAPCFLGAGAYDHFVPAVVNNLAARSEFYTAYTQYQAEISQGGLQALWEYQSLICELTGLDVANASLYDGATALAEAMHMACGATGRSRVVISAGIHPFYRQVLATYAHDLGIHLELLPTANGVTDKQALLAAIGSETAAVLLQSPNFLGCIENMDGIADSIHKQGGLLVAAVNPISLAILRPPGDYGADIAVGEGQPLGLGLNFGGPYLGFMAVREKFMRRMPGRIVGRTTDHEGRPGFVLTLQAREQHIRRGKAFSNICSNEGLCALMAAIYLTTAGKQGLVEVATLCAQKAHYAARQIAALPGYSIAFTSPFFLEFVVQLPCPASEIQDRLLAHNIIGGLDLAATDAALADHSERHMLFAVTEKRTKTEIDQLVAILGGKL
jgi:glycine dehydrogenase subunit 1